MARNMSFEMGLPPFRGAVRQIILASVAIYVVILLLVSFDEPVGRMVLSLGILDPVRIYAGWVWQFVTYAFMYVDPLDFVLSLVGFTFWARRWKSASASDLFTGSSLAVSCFREWPDFYCR